MTEQIVALECTNTWDVVPCPPTIPITYKWVYKIKTHSDDSMILTVPVLLITAL
jgi:hypothetical protein